MKYIIDIPNADVSRWVGVTPHGKKLYVPISVEDGNEYNIGTGIYVEEYTEPDRKDIEDEVWEFVKTLGSISQNQRKEIFGDIAYWYVLDTFDYQQAKAKYESWKAESEQIRVGDEVEYECCETIIRFVVCGIDNGVAYGFRYRPDFEDLDIGEYCEIDELKKTGRHFDEIEELLKKMGEE